MELRGQSHENHQGKKLFNPAFLLLTTTIQPVTNFSHKACRERFERLQNGTAKPTPESVEDPDENVKRRVESRAEKEAKLAALEKIKPQSLTRRELLTKHIRQERGH